MGAETVRRWFLPTLLALSSLGLDSISLQAQEPRPRTQIVEDLYDAQLLDANEGWAVGAFGSVYHTIDGGKHWLGQGTPTTQHLYGVSFANVENGWVVGRSGTILHTADGGAHWVAQQSNTSKHLFNVRFLDSQEGWAVGDWSVVLHTTNGGVTWRDRSLGEDRILYAVDFVDRDTGWMVGELGSIRRTIDGGRTWARQQVGMQKTLFGLAAVSKDKAWAVGIDGLVVRTVDGGVTWQVQRGEGEVESLERVGSPESLENAGLYDIEIRGGKGYAVGDVGNLLVSEDAGESWTRVLLPAEWRLSWIRGLSVLPSGRGIVVGASGLTFAVDGRDMHFSQNTAAAAIGGQID
ncbi:MAG: YCF48-related protein [Candidatus Binatia bacterium]